MGIESREPRGFEVYLSGVENLARQLQSGSDDEKETAREVLKGMRRETRSVWRKTIGVQRNKIFNYIA